MSFPTIIATATGFDSANSTSHTVNLPDGSNIVGRRVVVGFSVDSTPTITWPSGWVPIVSADGAAGNNRLASAYRDVDGTEGYPATGATINVTTNTAEEMAHTSYLLGDFDTGTAPVGAGNSQSSTGTDPNPPSLAPSGGAKDFLWLAFGGCDNGSVDFTGFPTNYNLSQLSTGNGLAGAGVAIGSAARQFNVDVEDPSAFTISVAEQRCALTIAIYPVSAPPGAEPRRKTIFTALQAVKRASGW